MKKPSSFSTTLYLFIFSAATLALASPETDSSRVAGSLRAFSDSDWAKIAGDRASERYEVSRGDTLWDISGRLFGDEKVWPKVWEINNTTIMNPHMIEPRMNLVFNSGTGLSLPSLAVGGGAPSALSVALNNTGTTTVKSHYKVAKEDRPGPVWDERTPFPSNEWRKLARQSWENVSVALPPNIDKDGFDTRNRIYLRKPATGLELPHLVACEPVKPLAKIEGSRSITTFVYRGSEVTIRSSGTRLEVNSIYSILDPTPSELSTTGRKALSYDILGKVKVLGVQSGTYVGEIQGSRDTIPRGALLVPEIKRIEKQPPVAGASKIKGTILADRRTGAFMSGQHKWVYIDRGSRDGVSPGMIFRIFQNTDPRTNTPLTRGEVFVSGDTQILQSCEHFSIGTFIWSRGEVPEQYEGVLLTDVADEKIRFYFNGEASDLPIAEPPSAALAPAEGIVDLPLPGPTENPETPLAPIEPSEEKEALVPEMVEEKKTAESEDWLDKLDNHKELESDEENELRELEKFRESEAAKAPPASDGADLPPPPTETTELSPAPTNDFPAQEPIVETPATVVNPNPPTKSAKGPKPSPTPADETSLDDLTPL